MILLSDANVLMDLGHVGGLTILPQIGTVEVLDIVLRECEHHSQPNLINEIVQVGIKTISAKPEWLSLISPDPKGQLSMEDTLNLYYAQTFQRVLLTNEKRLRVLCADKGVPVHGTLWIIRQAHSRQIEQPSKLCDWLDVLASLDRRLPRDEVVSLKQILGCL